MELIGSLFLILALALAVGLFIARPFLAGFSDHDASETDDAAQARDHQLSALMAERDRVLTALQELDFDNAMGKIPAEEYPIQRAALLKSGAETLRRLDEFNAGSAGDGSIEDRIEAAVAARRADLARKSAQPSREKQLAGVQVEVAAGNGAAHAGRADDLENIIASRKRERTESAAGFCPHCGKPVSKSDKFCSRCGATL